MNKEESDVEFIDNAFLRTGLGARAHNEWYVVPHYKFDLIQPLIP